ncbi:MAG: immunoglobulin domain-containing protein [Verrucomicrobiota bacterium]
MNVASFPVPVAPQGLRALVLALATWSFLQAPLIADNLVEVWRIAPGDRPYVSTGNTERGAAINPANGSVLLLGRAGGPKVYVLDGATGDDGSGASGAPRTLLATDANGDAIISGGTFTLNLVGAASDGAVFAANLATTVTTSPLRIYRWADDKPETPVEVAYSGNPLEGIALPGTGNDLRFGDALAVRGSGAQTQVLLSARSGRYLLLLQTQDGKTFTPKVLTTDNAGRIGLGLAFGDGNTAWAKAVGQPLTQFQLDPAVGTAKTLRTIPTTVVSGSVTGIGYDPQTKRLAAVNYVSHTLAAFDLADPANPVALGAPLPFATSNGNGTAAVGLSGDRIIALDTNNGLLAAKVEKPVVPDPPSIASQPAGATVYAGADFALAVSVQGTPPFSYQWSFNGQPLAGKTSSQLVTSGLTREQEGTYAVVVTNAAGSVTSRDAILTVKEPVSSARLQPLWSLAPGSRPYLNEDNTQRGLALNPLNGNILLVSRSGSNQVVVLDGQTGAEKHKLGLLLGDETPVSGGTFAVNQVGVANDGVVFVGNLTLDGSTTAFRLYRWENDSPESVPVLLPEIPELAVVERWGDAMAVRGSGDQTEVALTARNGGAFAILNVRDGGATVVAKVFRPEGLAAGDVGLGLAFGKGLTLWATATSKPLVQLGYDLASGASSILQSFPGSVVTTAVGPLGASADGSVLAGIAFENPDNLQLLDLAVAAEPTLVDQELIVSDRPNINGTGAVALGKDRAYALNSNNGIQAYSLSATPPAGPATLSLRLSAPTEANLSLRGTPGATYRIQSATTITGAFTTSATVTLPASGSADVSVPFAADAAFFTAVPGL